MANKIVEPAPVNPATTDWQNLLAKLTKTTGAFLVVDFEETGDQFNPYQVKAGSRFEINGSFFEVSVDELITGFVPASQQTPNPYVYAVPDQPGIGQASTCTFIYSATAPVYDVALGGMFDGVNRCLGWLEQQYTDPSTPRTYRLWSIDAIPARNVFISGIWRVPTPAIP